MTRQQFRQILTLSIVFFVPLIGYTAWKRANNVVGVGNAGVATAGVFAGKTIEWIIPFKEGGSGGIWARFNAPFFQKYMSGHPSVIVRNIPGGGSIKGANLFADRAKPDGTLLLGASATTHLAYLLGDPRVRFDYHDFKPIIAYPMGGVVYLSPTVISDRLRTWKPTTEREQVEKAAAIIRELKSRDAPLKFGSQGPTTLDTLPVYCFDLMQLDVQPIFGFRGKSVTRLAFERGELKVDFQTSTSYMKSVVPLVEKGEAIPLFSFGMRDAQGAWVKDDCFKDAPVGVFDGEVVRMNMPHFGEVYAQLGHSLSGIEWDTYSTFAAFSFGGMKLLLTPKETPDSVMNAFRAGIRAMKQDPEYQENKFKALGSYEQFIDEKADDIFQLATQMAEREKQHMKSWLVQKYDLNL